MNDGDRFLRYLIRIYKGNNHKFDAVYKYVVGLSERKELGMESIYAHRILTAWRRYLGKNVGDVGFDELENDSYNFGVLIGIASERLDITELR